MKLILEVKCSVFMLSIVVSHRLLSQIAGTMAITSNKQYTVVNCLQPQAYVSKSGLVNVLLLVDNKLALPILIHSSVAQSQESETND